MQLIRIGVGKNTEIRMGGIRDVWKATRRHARRLAADRAGAALPIMAAALIPLLGGIGTAVDVGRIYLVHHQLQAGVDAAALAGARAFGNVSATDEGRERQATIYFDENFPLGFMGTPQVTPTRDFQTVGGVNVTIVSARLDLPLIFMRLFGYDTHPVRVTARAELQPKPIEVMVVLDDTGSMQDRDVDPSKTMQRMDALKTAMHDFISVLHQGASTRAELAMGFVTYNVTTNVGAILQKAGVEVEPLDGFTNVSRYTGGSNVSPANGLAWRGCVANDESLAGQDLSASPTTFEEGAWDIRPSLPGEMHEGVKHPAVKPYLFPPNATTALFYPDPSDPKKTLKAAGGGFKTTQTEAAAYAPDHAQNNNTDGRTNNFYRLAPKGAHAQGQILANTPAYKQFFYDFYIGLNATSANPDDDVIVSTSGGYYAPGSGPNWKVEYSRIPFIDDDTRWGTANANFGYPLTSKHSVEYPDNIVGRTGATLRMPSPNYQCPEPAMDVQYGRPKQTYDDYVDSENYAVMPASGTLHHIGFLWGYRLLSRSDRFTRENPIPSEQPLRALVFMTDGQTIVGDDGRWNGAYGHPREKRISKTASSGAMKTQIMRRFAKVCESAKQEGIVVYIVSLIQREPEFSTCAGARYWHTTDRDTIKSAFNEIAVDLVDLHLTR